MYAIRSYYEERGHQKENACGRNTLFKAESCNQSAENNRSQHLPQLVQSALDAHGGSRADLFGNFQLENKGGLGRVITSYSIHYTKLYDIPSTGPGRNRLPTWSALNGGFILDMNYFLLFQALRIEKHGFIIPLKPDIKAVR